MFLHSRWGSREILYDVGDAMVFHMYTTSFTSLVQLPTLLSRIRKWCRPSACRACPTCPKSSCQHCSILLSVIESLACRLSPPPTSVLIQTHLGHVSCRTQHTRHKDNVGKCEPSCSFRPAEVLVAVGGHVYSSSIPDTACTLSSTLHIVFLALLNTILSRLRQFLRCHGGLWAVGSEVNVLAHLTMAGSEWITACCQRLRSNAS
jgi:hypothetical protein